MGKSYAEKVKAKRNRNSGNRNSNSKRSKPNDERKDKFPIAPVVVIVIIVSLIIATVVFYQVQNDDGGGDGPGDDNGGGNGGNSQGDLPQHAYTQIENVNGGLFSLEDHLGKVVIVDMFATWCGPCAYQMDELISLRSFYSASEVVILSVDTDLQETVSDVLNFKSDYPSANWPFAMSNSEFNSHFPASSIPTMYILNKELEVVNTEVGVTGVDDLRAKIDPLL